MNYVFSFLQILEAPEQHKNCFMNLNSAFLLFEPLSFQLNFAELGDDPGNEVFPSYLSSSGISKKGEEICLPSELYTSPESVHTRR